MKIFYVQDKDKHILYATYLKNSIEDFYKEYPSLINKTLIVQEDVKTNDIEKILVHAAKKIKESGKPQLL